MMKPDRMWIVIAASALLACMTADLIAGRAGRGGSIRGGARKNAPRLPGNKYAYGDSYAGESRKSSADRRRSSPEPRPSIQDKTVSAVPRGNAGEKVQTLPAGANELYAGGRKIYYYAGIYYRPVYVSGEVSYVTEDPPYGAVVTELPSDFTIEEIGGTTYYIVDGDYYRRIFRGGEVAYIVTKKP